MRFGAEQSMAADSERGASTASSAGLGPRVLSPCRQDGPRASAAPLLRTQVRRAHASLSSRPEGKAVTRGLRAAVTAP